MKKIIVLTIATFILAGCKTQMSTTVETQTPVEATPETVQTQPESMTAPTNDSMAKKDDSVTDLQTDLNSTTVVQEDFN